MDLEAALETQRLALLRLLAGWSLVAGFVSGAPFVLPLPRSLRRFFASLLIRAELAAHYLLRVSVCLQGGGDGRSIELLNPAPLAEHDDTPSVEALVHRIEALRALLEDLPRVARRMVRKGSSGQGTERRTFGRSRSRIVQSRLIRMSAVFRPKTAAPRAERPPDLSSDLRVNFTSLRVSGREAQVVGP